MDFEVIMSGSLVGIRPISADAKSWIDENVASEGWQWLGPVLYLDPVNAFAIAGDMTGDGLEMQK